MWNNREGHGLAPCRSPGPYSAFRIPHSAFVKGSVTWKVLPWSSALSTQMRPPLCTTISWEMKRPRPRPPGPPPVLLAR